MDYDTTTTGTGREAYVRCVQELARPDPDFQAAQVYATLSVEEALRDLAGAIHRAASQISRTFR